MEEHFLPRRNNRDGTRNIYCRQCHRVVGTSNGTMGFGSVSSCAICLAAEEGVVLPPEVLESLDQVRLPGDGLFVSQFVMQEAKRAEEAQKERKGQRRQ